MLIIDRSPPKHERVELGSGAYVMVRPATSADNYLQQSEVQALTAGLVAGGNATAIAQSLFGEEFGQLDIFNPIHIAAIAQRFALLKLAELCVSEVGGLAYEDGSLVEANRTGLALVLRDARWAMQISAVINKSLYREQAEGNAFAASLNGEAAADAPTAPNASPVAAAVPTEH